MKFVRDLATLTRVYMSLLAALTAVVSALISRVGTPIETLLWVALGIFGITAGGFVLNDCFDMARDSINRPNRPLVSRRVSRRTAIILATFLLTLGVAAASQFNLEAQLCAFAEIVLVACYSSVKNRSAIFGNFQVGIMAAGAFVFGCLAVGRGEIAWLPSLAIASATIGREIIKDVGDMEGDRKVGLKTLPILCGINFAVNCVYATYLSAGVVAAIFSWFYQSSPLASLILLVNGIALAVMLFIAENRSPLSAAAVDEYCNQSAIIIGVAPVILLLGGPIR